MENKNEQAHGTVNAFKALEYILNVINHVLIGFVTIYMTWLCIHEGLGVTALHAWLVTLGFVFLTAEGIMCHYPGNVLTFTYNRDIKTRAHWILQALGGGLGMIGTLVKTIQAGFRLSTTHGQLGFAAFILCAFSMLSGLSALYSMRLKRLLSPLLNKTVHNLLGYVTFFIAILAQYYGYKTRFFDYYGVTTDLQDLIICVTFVSLALTSIGPIKAFIRKTQLIYKQYVK